MEDLTIYTKGNEYTISIDENKVLAESEVELEILKKENEHCFSLNSIEHEGQKYILKYEIEEGYKPIVMSKKYSTVLRLSILEKILSINPLESFEDKVLLHPQNIFFKDLKTIKFMYRSNKFIPYIRNYTELEQYKLIVLSILSPYPFEKLKINKNSLLNKINDGFLFEVDKTRSIEELHKLVLDKLNADETKHFQDIEIKRKTNLRKKAATIVINGAVILIVLILAAGISKISNNKVEEVYSSQIEWANNKADAYRDLSLGDYKDGINLLRKSGYTKAQIADVYLQFNQYDNAINEDDSYAKKVVQQLYLQGKQKDILKLKTNNSYVNTEKQIVSYNYNYLLAGKQLITDKDQLKRLALAFIAHNNVVDAYDVNTRLKDKDVAAAITEKNLIGKVNELKTSISQETDTTKISQIQLQINDLTKQYQNIQKKEKDKK